MNATMVTTPLSEMSQHQELSSGSKTLGQSLTTTHQMGPVVEGTSGRYAVAFSTTDVAATMPFIFTSVPQWTIASPEWLGPMTLHFQDWFYDGNFFYNTQRLTVPLIK